MQWRSAILFLIAIGLAPSALADGIGLDGTWKVGAYQVTIENIENAYGAPTATLTVTQSGKTIYAIKNAVLWLNPAGFFADRAKMDYDASMSPVGIGTDILRLGNPTLVVWGFSLGAHCCFDLTILSLGEKFHAMPTIHLYDSEYVDFRPAPNHTALVMSAKDWIFAYWRAPFAGSSVAPVTLAYNSAAGRYLADSDLMHTPAPSATQLAAEAAAAKAAYRKARDDGQTWVTRDVTQPILDLIYGGHLTEARSFLVDAWIGTPEDRDDYWRDLTQCQLRLSQFWPVVAKMNGLPAEKPVGKCPRPF
jgi:hypothetical protein